VPPSLLSTYVDRVRRRAPRLSRADERRLARRLRARGDLAAARALVAAHLPLVVRLARGFRRLHPNVLELVQEGNLALIRAVHRFDPERDVRLAAYAASWVRTYIARFILANLAAARGFVVEGADAAEARGLRQALRAWEAEIEGEELAGDDAAELGDVELTMMALMTDQAAERAPDLLLERQEDERRLAAALPEFERQLTPREREIFRSRLIAERPSTLSQTGAELGLSAERIRQIERDLTERLRARLAAGEAHRG
jgi:RNA polymerase sigma-32 factor